MHVQQALARQQSNNLNHPALPSFESSFAAYVSRTAGVYSCEVPLLAARLSALRAADEHGLPMTVFRRADTHGWAYTNPMSRVLYRSEVFVTILPFNYFK